LSYPKSSISHVSSGSLGLPEKPIRFTSNEYLWVAGSECRLEEGWKTFKPLLEGYITELRVDVS